MKIIFYLLLIFLFCLIFPNKVFAADIVINEYFPNPTGSPENDEWIEIYNSSDTDIDISGWKLDDLPNQGSDIYIIPSNSVILSKGFFVLEKSETGIILNNVNESIRIINNLDEIVDEYFYEDSKDGISYGRQIDGDSLWIEFSVSSKNSSNINGIAVPTNTPIPSSTPEPSKTPTPTKTPTPSPLPTSLPSETPTPSKKLSPTKMISKTPTIKKITPTEIKDKVVLGGEDSKIEEIKQISPTPEVKVKGVNNTGFIFISLGGVSLIACGILAYYLKSRT